MYNGGDSSKKLTGKVYSRFNCATNTLCFLAIAEGDVCFQLPPNANTWYKDYAINNNPFPPFPSLPGIVGVGTEGTGGWEGEYRGGDDYKLFVLIRTDHLTLLGIHFLPSFQVALFMM